MLPHNIWIWGLFAVRNSEWKTKTSVADLLSALDVVHGQPLLSIEIEDLQSRVENLTWVRSASIHRYFPDRLHINLVEHMPIALWQDDRIFKPLMQMGTSLMCLHRLMRIFFVAGPGAPGATSDLLVTLSTQPKIAQRITAATRVGLRRWDLWLGDVGDGGIRIKLPETNVEYALSVLADLDRRYDILSRPIEMIDMRLSGRLILQLAIMKDKDPRSPSGRWLREKPLEISPNLSENHRV